MVETIRLESGHTLTGIVGSNPTLSARLFIIIDLNRGDTSTDTEIGKGLRYCSVVLAGNGRSNPNTVMVDGKPELHREGAYYLEWREGLRSLGVRIPTPSQDNLLRDHRCQGSQDREFF